MKPLHYSELPILLLLFLYFYAAIKLAIGGQVLPRQPQEPLRARQELCEEVRYELGLSVKEGLMTQPQAEDIYSRCNQTK